MLRRFSLGLTGVIAAATMVAACSSSSATHPISIGPSYAAQSVYATNSTQNGISIYPAGTASGSGPANSIAGSNTTLNGPQYLTFDSSGDIYTTNWAASTSAASIIEFKALATGNVLPYDSYAFTTGHPRGIADFSTTASGSTTKTDFLLVGVVDSSEPLTFSNQLQLFEPAIGVLAPVQIIAGPNTGLNVPTGVAVDGSGNYYVANNQGASVEKFTVPTPSPTPSPTATPSPTPSPTATPAGATPSPTPTVAPTATPMNLAPVATISGATSGLGLPTGVALDSNGNIYVVDQNSSLCGCAAILKYAAGGASVTPLTTIYGSATLLHAPTDIRVDSKGQIYVADSTTAGAGVIYIFASTASGNVAPVTTYTSTGSVIGLALSP